MARPKTKTRSQVVHDYEKKAYDRVALLVKKGEREKIRAHAEARGESVNGFLNRAIRETMERDGEP